MTVFTVEQVDRPAVRWPTSEFTGVQIAVLFVALTLLISIPVWTHPLPPLSDYVNHLARMHVIATIRSNADLARFYEIDWQIIPNLAMDLIVPFIGRYASIYLAGQIFTVGVFALIISGTLALNRTLVGRWSVLPFVALPLLYNYVFLVGLMNYMFGVGLALWAMATWIWLRERSWPLRLAVSTAFAVGTVLLPPVGARHLRHRPDGLRAAAAVVRGASGRRRCSTRRPQGSPSCRPPFS